MSKQETTKEQIAYLKSVLLSQLLLESNEELSQTHSLMKVNKKNSNKSAYSSSSKTVFKKKTIKTNTIKRK
jgi:hypothetical protein